MLPRLPCLSVSKTKEATQKRWRPERPSIDGPVHSESSNTCPGIDAISWKGIREARSKDTLSGDQVLFVITFDTFGGLISG